MSCASREYQSCVALAAICSWQAFEIAKGVGRERSRQNEGLVACVVGAQDAVTRSRWTLAHRSTNERDDKVGCRKCKDDQPSGKLLNHPGYPHMSRVATSVTLSSVHLLVLAVPYLAESSLQ